MNRPTSRAVYAWASALAAAVPHLAPEERAPYVDLHDAACAVLERRAPPGRLEPLGARPTLPACRDGLRLKPPAPRGSGAFWGGLRSRTVRCVPVSAADRESARLEREALALLRGGGA